MKTDQCLGCKSSSSNVVGRSNSFNELAGTNTFKQEAYSVLKCNNCGLYYKDHFLNAFEFNDYYNSFNYKAWAPIVKYPTEEIVLKYLTSVSHSRILDYGCSDGRFLSTFVGKNDCYGFDIDQRAIQIAKTKGIQIISDSTEIYLKYFDVIVLSDVFEHSTTPTILIQHLLSLLNDNGVLIISTGYADSRAARYDLANFWYFRTVQHVCMMGKDYVDYLEKHFEIRSIKKFYCSHYRFTIKEKLFYKFRFNAFKFVKDHRKSFLVNAILRLPYLRKLKRWEYQPYYPSSKDHIVLFVQK